MSSLPDAINHSSSWLWCTTSYVPPSCGYSFFSVLKQCGHWATIFFTPMPLSVSTFCMASIWKMYSLPERRAWSPLHSSLGPRIAKSMPARWSSFARARLVLVLQRRARLDDLDTLELPGPVAPVALVEPVRVAGVLHGPVRVAELGWEV